MTRQRANTYLRTPNLLSRLLVLQQNALARGCSFKQPRRLEVSFISVSGCIQDDTAARVSFIHYVTGFVP